MISFYQEDRSVFKQTMKLLVNLLKNKGSVGDNIQTKHSLLKKKNCKKCKNKLQEKHLFLELYTLKGSEIHIDTTFRNRFIRSMH